MKKLLSISFLTFVLVLSVTGAALAMEQTIVGKWKTISDKDGSVESIVDIYEQEGEYFGKIIKLFREPGEDPSPVCSKCNDDDPRKGQPIIGMEIIKNLKKDGNEYSDGTILDPDAGDAYGCKLWIEDGKLLVRGYLAFLFRTQTWLPAE